MAAATVSSSADATEPGTEPVFARHAETVLLVDDEELVRAATAEMLRDVGYKVIEFGSDSQALSALRSGIEGDVVVSDYLMPG